MPTCSQNNTVVNKLNSSRESYSTYTEITSSREKFDSCYLTSSSLFLTSLKTPPLEQLLWAPPLLHTLCCQSTVTWCVLSHLTAPNQRETLETHFMFESPAWTNQHDQNYQTLQSESLRYNDRISRYLYGKGKHMK